MRQYPFDDFENRKKTGDYIPGTHAATDYGLTIGTPLYAPWDGVVEYGDEGNLGIGVRASNQVDVLPAFVLAKTISIKLSNISYFHNSKRVAAKGVKVKRGQIVALSGDRGSPGSAHVHLQMQDLDGNLIDPEWTFGCWRLWDNVDDINQQVATLKVKLDGTSGAVLDQVRKQLAEAYIKITDLTKNLQEKTLELATETQTHKTATAILNERIGILEDGISGRDRKIRELLRGLEGSGETLLKNATLGQLVSQFFKKIRNGKR
jgi:hypothetical protein